MYFILLTKLVFVFATVFIKELYATAVSTFYEVVRIIKAKTPVKWNLLKNIMMCFIKHISE